MVQSISLQVKIIFIKKYPESKLLKDVENLYEASLEEINNP